MADLRRLVIEASRRRGLGGVAVGVVRKDAPAAVECLGLADRVSGRRVDRDTVFRIASISKTLTAIGVMQLRDQGLLALDDPVNRYLKSIRVDAPTGAPDVTFRHLLTHTAGIGEVPKVSDLWRRESWGGGKPFAAPSDLADLYGGTLRTEVAAGSKWAYANHGFAVLGRLVHDITGRPFAEYMREQVLRPLGMERSDYLRTERVSETLATGYHWIFGRFGAIKDYDVTLLGPGSVLAPLADMVEYATWLVQAPHGTHTNVLAPATLDEMTSAQFSIDARIAGMGLAFFLDRLGTHRVYGHDGNNPGFASALLVAPDDDAGVVVLTNTSTFVGAHLLAASVLRSILGIADPAGCLPRADVSSNPHLWPELTGAYAPRPGFLTNLRTWEMTGGEVQVFVRDRRLHVRALSPLPPLRRGLELHPTDDNDPLLFAVEIDGLVIPVAFRAGDSGRIDTVCVGAPALATFHRRSPSRSSRRRLTTLTGVGLAIAATRARSSLSRARVSRRSPRGAGGTGSGRCSRRSRR
jgi:CubicO group peptidase (beta-lactamase class C family)